MDNQRGAPVGKTPAAFTEEAFLHSGATDQGARGRLARVSGALALPLTLLSALLFLIGFWAPWLYQRITITFKSPGPVGPPFAVSGSDATLLGVLSFISPQRTALYTMSPLLALVSIWDGLPFVGIVLAVALWRSQTRPRWLLGAYTVWLAFATALTGLGAYRTSVLLTQPDCPSGCIAPTAYQAELTWGLFVTLFALALAWAALVALLRRRARVDATQSASGDAASGRAVVASSLRRSHVYLLASGVFTLGLALWAMGLFFTPWVTAGCTGVPITFAHFAHGSCMGLDGYDMLLAGLNHVGWADDQSLVVGSVVRVMYALTFAGVVVAWLLWAPGRTRLTRLVGVLGALWALLAMLMSLVGWQGATSNVGQPAQLVFGAHALWGIGPGVWLCAAGAVLAWVGAMVVWARGSSDVAHPRAAAHTPHVDRGEA